MSKSQKEERIGEIIKGENGTCAIIVGWRSSNDMTVMFADGTPKKGQYHNFLKSLVHPKKEVRGIAYRGNVEDLDVKPKEEREWHNMLARCYHKDGTVKVREHGYKVVVCERWKCLAYFVEDIRKMKNYDKWLECEDNTKKDGYHLDKDMGCFFKDDGYFMIERIYSPSTCNFVTTEINQQFRSWVQDKFYYGKITSVLLCAKDDMEHHVKQEHEKIDYKQIEIDYQVHKKFLESCELLQEHKKRHMEQVLKEREYFKNLLDS